MSNISIIRQNDTHNCGIFAIDGICHYFKLKSEGNDLFSFAKYKSSLVREVSNIKVFDFHNLPPQMMKLTQSLTQIKKYMEQNPLFANEVVKEKKKENLVQNVARYTYVISVDGFSKQLNCHANIKAARYRALLLLDEVSKKESSL